MRRVLVVPFFAFFTLLLSACLAPTPTPTRPPTQTLTVFAAASLTEAFTEIGQAFEAAHPGVSVEFNFGGSQSLRTQLEQGAVANVFASANAKEMNAAIAAGWVASGTAQVFLTNRLVVILPATNPGNVQTLADLARPGLKLVLAAEEVPAGAYARQMLGNLNATYGAEFQAQALANVVSNEENVRTVLAKVQLGEADAGVVYASDAIAALELPTLAIPPAENVIAEYPIAVLSPLDPSSALARAFVAYVLSAEGQTILQTWGFGPAR